MSAWDVAVVLNIPEDRDFSQDEAKREGAKVSAAYRQWLQPAERTFVRLVGSRQRVIQLGVAVLLGTAVGETTNVEDVVMRTMRILLDGAPLRGVQ